MDDICPTMNWGKFNRLLEMFYKYNVVPLLGVIPENKDSFLQVDPESAQFWTILKKYLAEGKIEVAQHGTYHQYVNSNKGILARKFGFPGRSEFVGLTYEAQLEKLSMGKKILENHGVITNYFMAPSHSYDEGTLQALSNLRFIALTDGVSRFPYKSHDLIFVPQIHWAPDSRTKGISTICIHSNEMTDRQIEKIENFLRRHNHQVIKFSEALNYVKPYSRLFALYWKAKFYLIDKFGFTLLVAIRRRLTGK